MFFEFSVYGYDAISFFASAALIIAYHPHFMFASTIALLLVLYRIDRAPKIMSLDYSDVD